MLGELYFLSECPQRVKLHKQTLQIPELAGDSTNDSE